VLPNVERHYIPTVPSNPAICWLLRDLNARPEGKRRACAWCEWSVWSFPGCLLLELSSLPGQPNPSLGLDHRSSLAAPKRAVFCEDLSFLAWLHDHNLGTHWPALLSLTQASRTSTLATSLHRKTPPAFSFSILSHGSAALCLPWWSFDVEDSAEVLTNTSSSPVVLHPGPPPHHMSPVIRRDKVNLVMVAQARRASASDAGPSRQ
jgi:hypothetical protein